MAEELADRLDAYAETVLATGAASAMAVAVTDGERTLAARTYGVPDDTMFQFGSIGKSFTAIVALQLAEQGLLDLHAPVTEVLPWFAVGGTAAPITLHHLLTHSSGLIRGAEIATGSNFDVVALADTARRLRGGGDEVFFVNNLYLNFTNVCRVKCKFCAFAVTGKQPSAYTWEIDKLVEHAVEVHERERYSEIHMVGGENPHLEYSYYIDLTRELHDALPDVHLKLYTASEIHHMHKLSGLPHAQILTELQEVGLGSLPGGGAEVFADRVRRLVAPGKEHPDNWIATHRAAHGIGMPTHCTMLYGHVENYEERVEHWMRLRDLQDETGGFLAFVPLPFHPENTVFQRRGWRFSTGYDDLKMVAASRLMLDNIPNIKAYWIMLSTPVAQVALHYGANDIQGTVMEEQIAHAAGAVTPQEEKVQSLVTLIRDAGRIPVQRDTLYNVVRTFA